MFECEIKNKYGIENQNDVSLIHNKEVNHIFECNSLYDIINPPKHTKILNSHYSPIINGCMNTIRGKEKFKKFRIIFDSGCSSKIVLVRLVKKHILKNML